MSALFRILLIALLATLAFAQDSATVSGTVVDQANFVVPDAKITLLDVGRGAIRHTVADPAGFYIFSSLTPGLYSVEVTKKGFNTLRVERLRLGVRDRKTLILELQVAPAEPTVVTITAETGGVSTDPNSGTPIGYDFSTNLPLNSRSVRTLISMAPGVASAEGESFNVNGLRANTNYFTVDGVSGEIGVEGSRGPGGGFGGGPGRGMRGGGGGEPAASLGSMISLEAVEDVQVQTSSFAPEFGRTPGAQVSITSRSGTNEFRGSAYWYYRNDQFSANDWFANSRDIARGKMRHNNFGVTFGGPIAKGRTYFFASYEGLRNDIPQVAYSELPSLETRAAASEEMQPYLNAFPIPNGPALQDGAAEFWAMTSSQNTTDSAGLRIDHQISDTVNVFGRYRYAPYDRESRGSGMQAANTITTTDGKAQAITAAVMWTPDAFTTNDFRVNLSTSTDDSYLRMDNFGGAVPLTDDLLFPSGVSSPNGSFSLNVIGASGYAYGLIDNGKQHQLNIVDSLSHLKGNHQLKFGFDFRRLAPTDYNQFYRQTAMFNGLSASSGGLLSGETTSAIVSAYEPTVYPVFYNFSLYGQDTWKATSRTTITYGLRWDVNPAPDVREGPPPIAATSTLQFASITRLNPLYKTRWTDFSPRAGLAYMVDTTQGRELVFRAGYGIFNDIGYGATASAFDGAPYVSQRTLTAEAFPLVPDSAAPPELPATRPYGQISAADPFLESPKVHQWNILLEKGIGTGRTLSLGYVGTSGKNLLQTTTRRDRIPTSDGDEDLVFGDYDIMRLTQNGAESSYHGAQVQFRQRMSRNLQMQLSYTWSKSLDTASNDEAMAGFGTVSEGDRGPSNYDIRHSASLSGSYLFPAPRKGIVGAILNDWWTDWFVTARSALPFDVRNITMVTSDDEEDDEDGFRGLFGMGRPHYTGEPIWISDGNVPGGKRLNPDAFEVPDDYEQGDLGRNSIRGFNVFQVDLSLRRQFSINEKLRLHATVQAFNVLNHPNFANLSPNQGANMASPNFGIATSMLNRGLGSSGNAMYRVGGPRTLQFALRLQF